MSGFTINTVTVSGNLTRDPEVRQLPSGTSVTSLRLAVNESYKDSNTGEWSDRPNYFDVTVWKGLGEAVAKQLSKGDAIAVSGRLRWREWGEEGSKRQSVDIIADSVLPSPRNGSSGGGGGGARQQQQEVPIDTGGLPPAGAAPYDDDIPF